MRNSNGFWKPLGIIAGVLAIMATVFISWFSSLDGRLSALEKEQGGWETQIAQRLTRIETIVELLARDQGIRIPPKANEM